MKAISMLTLAILTTLPVVASDRGAEQERLVRAETVIKAALDSPDKGIPKELLERAECVGVFPDVKKAAFIVGGQGGRDVFTCRDESGELGAPAFFKFAGGSVGWQFGGQWPTSSSSEVHPRPGREGAGPAVGRRRHARVDGPLAGAVPHVRDAAGSPVARRAR